MRPIDADALKEKIDNIWNGRPLSFLGARILATIDHEPTIDAVKIVRCKDCKHYSVKGKTTQFGFCGYRYAGTDETDYCSRAVRRKE